MIEFKDEDLVVLIELTEQRDDKIDYLIQLLEMNDSVAKIRSSELLQEIFNINTQIQLKEEKILIKKLNENDDITN
jgi:hypothetical protein